MDFRDLSSCAIDEKPQCFWSICPNLAFYQGPLLPRLYQRWRKRVEGNFLIGRMTSLVNGLTRFAGHPWDRPDDFRR